MRVVTTGFGNAYRHFMILANSQPQGGEIERLHKAKLGSWIERNKPVRIGMFSNAVLTGSQAENQSENQGKSMVLLGSRWFSLVLLGFSPASPWFSG